jgi:hypothetical protein
LENVWEAEDYQDDSQKSTGKILKMKPRPGSDIPMIQNMHKSPLNDSAQVMTHSGAPGDPNLNIFDFKNVAEGEISQFMRYSPTGAPHMSMPQDTDTTSEAIALNGNSPPEDPLSNPHYYKERKFSVINEDDELGYNQSPHSEMIQSQKMENSPIAHPDDTKIAETRPDFIMRSIVNVKESSPFKIRNPDVGP